MSTRIDDVCDAACQSRSFRAGGGEDVTDDLTAMSLATAQPCPVGGCISLLEDPDALRIDDVAVERTAVGDPVLAQSGELLIEETDFSFPSPGAPFELKRTYLSQSDERSTLGSNWSHNFEVKLEEVRPGHVEHARSPFCGVDGVTCFAFRSGNTERALFVQAPGADELVALGSSKTLRREPDGSFRLTAPDSAVQTFDSDGYLTSQLDRFGNGYTLKYEPTPLYQVYDRYCLHDDITVRDPRICATLQSALRIGPSLKTTTWGPVDSSLLYTKKCGYAGTTYLPTQLVDWSRRKADGSPSPTVELLRSPDDVHRKCRGTGSDFFCGLCGADEGGTTLLCDANLMKSEVSGELPQPNEKTSFNPKETVLPATSREPWSIKFGYDIHGLLDIAVASRTFIQKLRTRTDAELLETGCSTPGWNRFGGFLPSPRPKSMREWFSVDSGLIYDVVTFPDEAAYGASATHGPGAPEPRPAWLGAALEELQVLVDRGSIRAGARAKHGTFITPSLPYRLDKRRVSRITDSLGRRFDFQYYAGKEPFAGLLQQVDGPIGSGVRYLYRRAEGLPPHLEEFLLEGANRWDAQGDGAVQSPVVEGIGRMPLSGVAYRYDGPAPGGDFQELRRAMLPTPELIAANAGRLASSLVDNIVAVEFEAPGEAKSRQLLIGNRFGRDPKDPETFDKVTRQWGRPEDGRVVFDPTGSRSDHVPGPRPVRPEGPRKPEDPRRIDSSWFALVATRPKNVWDDFWGNHQRGFQYIDALDASTAIPAELLSKYPEDQSYGESPKYPPRMQAGSPATKYVRPEHAYFARKADHRLVRTRLHCSQLERAARDDIEDLALGRKSRNELDGRDAGDAERICAWTLTVDREGFATWLGFDWRGRALVEASADRDLKGLVVTEHLFDANGLKVEDRRPVLGGNPWTINDGTTRFVHQGVASEDAHAWRARANVVRVEELARGGSVTDFDDGGAKLSRGRLQAFEYEPHHNQVVRVAAGVLGDDGDHVDHETRWQFDQACAAAAAVALVCDTNGPCTATAALLAALDQTVRELPKTSASCARADDCIEEWRQPPFANLSALAAGIGDVDLETGVRELQDLYERGKHARSVGRARERLQAAAALLGSARSRDEALAFVGSSAVSPRCDVCRKDSGRFDASTCAASGEGCRDVDVTVERDELLRQHLSAPLGSLLLRATAIGSTSGPAVQEQFLKAEASLESTAVAPQEIVATFSALVGELQHRVDARLAPERISVARAGDANPCAQKAPMAVIMGDPLHPSTARTTRLAFAANGLPLRIEQLGGTTTELRYDGVVAGRGMLSSVAAGRFDSDFGAFMPAACGSGPHRFVLGEACSTRDAILGPELAKRLAAETSVTTLSIEYSPTGHPTNTVADGLKTTYVRNIDGRVGVETSPSGVVTTTTYTPRGLPARITARHGAGGAVLEESVTRYNELRQVREQCVALEAGGCDEASVVEDAERPRRQVTQFAFGEEGTLYSVVLPGGLSRVLSYDDRRNMTSVVETDTGAADTPTPARRIESFCRTLDGDVWLHGRGSRVVSCAASPSMGFGASAVANDDFGVAEQTDCPASGVLDDNASVVETFRFDGLRRPVLHIDARGTPTRTQYDDRGLARRIERGSATCGAHTEQTRRYDDHGQLAEVADGGLTTEIVYGPWGRSSMTTTKGSGTSLVVRDAAGAPTWSRGPDGVEHFEMMDAAARQLTSGRIMRATAKEAGEARVVYQTTTLDSNGAETSIDVVGLGAGARMQETTSIGRDPLGRATAIDAPGQPQRSLREMNLAGWSSRRCDGSACAVLTYDVTGNVTAVRDPLEQITTSMHNAWGEPTSIQHAGTSAPEVTTYDALGRAASSTRTDGTVLVTRFDSHGDRREMRLRGAQGPLLLRWERDALGQLVAQAAVQDGDGLVVEDSFAYDSLGRLTTQTTHIPNALEQALVTHHVYALDGDAWTRTTTTPSNATTVRRFDSAGRMRALGGAQETVLDWLGNDVVQRVRGDTVAHVDLDGLGRPKARSHSAIGLTERILRDSAGRVERSTRQLQLRLPEGAGESQERPEEFEGYRYTEGRLAEQWTARGPARPFAASLVEDVGVRSALPQPIERNAVGSVETTAGTPALSLHRGAGHRLTTVELDGRPRAIAYDDEGNVETLGELTLRNDALGRLASVSRAGVVVERYLYAADGQLAGTVDAQGASHFYAREGAQLAGAYDKRGRLEWEATWGPGLDDLVLFATPAGERAAVVDHRRSVVALVDEHGVATETARYDTDGRVQIESAAGDMLCDEPTSDASCGLASMPFGFHSAWKSPASGFVFMRNRWYAPQIGAFLAPDPLGFVDSYDRYLFAGGDPVNRWDPWGLSSGGFADASNSSWRGLNPLSGVRSAAAAFDVQMHEWQLGVREAARSGSRIDRIRAWMQMPRFSPRAILGRRGSQLLEWALPSPSHMSSPGGPSPSSNGNGPVAQPQVPSSELALHSEGDPSGPDAPNSPSRGRAPGSTTDAATGSEVGRFIVDPRGNTMIEPVGGRTVPHPNGVDTHTTYPNGSNYHRLNPQGHQSSGSIPHGHGHLQGTGPNMKGQGPSIDIHGNPVAWNSDAAHWEVK